MRSSTARYMTCPSQGLVRMKLSYFARSAEHLFSLDQGNLIQSVGRQPMWRMTPMLVLHQLRTSPRFLDICFLTPFPALAGISQLVLPAQRAALAVYSTPQLRGARTPSRATHIPTPIRISAIPDVYHTICDDW